MRTTLKWHIFFRSINKITIVVYGIKSLNKNQQLFSCKLSIKKVKL